MKDKRVLVVSAHAADFVWRAGGTIAKYIENGAQVRVLVLSLGIRGESNDLWKDENQTAERVGEIRKAESLAAAKELGITDIDFWDYEDYPLVVDAERINRLVLEIRRVQPQIIITHDKHDAFNPDHTIVHDYVFRCSVMSNSAGVRTPGYKHTKQMAIFGFEPHQTEISGFYPGTFIDITQTYNKKIAAMNCFKAQSHLIEIYTQRVFLRGNHARRVSGKTEVKYAECFANQFPVVAGEFAV
jgi:4-oxalomesaconate hydratase